MAFYPVDEIDNRIKAYMNRIVIMCAMPLLTLDEYRRMALLNFISEYITMKSRDDEQIHNANYYIDHDSVMNSYPMNMRGSVHIILTARDLMVHDIDSEEQRLMWSRAWDKGHIEHVLKYEGFL